MLTITVPTELAIPPLAEEATRRGTTPELLALEGVRGVLPISPGTTPAEGLTPRFLGRTRWHS